MNHEDRLKQILDSSATDPGPKQDWDEFVHTARRHRLVHRVVLAGTAAVFVLLIVFATVALSGLLGETTPRPAEEDKRQEREIDDDEKEDRERDRDATKDPERKKKSKNARIVPGPGKVPGSDEEGKTGAGKDAGADKAADIGTNDEDLMAARDASCDGRKATIVGTAGNDQLAGTDGADVIAGLGGKDTIRGNGGDDIICGDFGDDMLMGGRGDDRFEGGAGSDFVSFPTARADINVNFEQRFIQGDGNDRVAGVEGAVGTAYSDNLSGDGNANFLIGGGGDDAMNGFDGDDILVPGPGDDAMAGHAGSDTVRFGSGGSGIRIDLAAHDGPNDDVVAIGEGTDSLNFIENVRGTIHDDVISGNPKRNTFLGMGGDDTLSGREGSDALVGGGGTDEIDGGPDSDTCSGGETQRGCEQRAS